MIRHHNPGYSSGYPLAVGDRYYSQDLLRDFRHLQQFTGDVLQRILDLEKAILNGLVVTQGSGHTINITAGKAFTKYNVTIPDPTDTWAVPPNTDTDDIYIPIVISTDLSDQAITSAVTDGSTVNYVKLAYNEADGNTRSRAKKAGSYAYEVIPSYTLSVDDTAPTDYEVTLQTFTSNGITITWLGNEDTRVDISFRKLNSFDVWVQGQQGTDLNISTISGISITALSPTRIAYIDETNSKLRTYEFNGKTWSLIGNEFTLSSNTPTITALSSTRIAYFDIGNTELRTYDFDGTDWSQTGNSLYISGAASDPIITAMTSSRIAFVDDSLGLNVIRTYDFDGSDWSLTGNSFSLNTPISARITAMTSSRIAYIDESEEYLKTYEFDGSDWSQIGNSLSISGITTGSITTIFKNKIILAEKNASAMSAYEFDGDDWHLASNALTISGMGNPTVTAMTSSRIAFIDASNEDLRVYKLSLSPILEEPFDVFDRG